MVDLRSDLIESRSKNAVLEKELQNTLEQLHAAQLQVHASSGHDANAESVRKKLVSPGVQLIITIITFSYIYNMHLECSWTVCVYRKTSNKCP